MTRIKVPTVCEGRMLMKRTTGGAAEDFFTSRAAVADRSTREHDGTGLAPRPAGVTGDMTFSIAPGSNGAVVLRLVGELDVVTYDSLRVPLDELVEARTPVVEIDLSQLRMIDSVGIGLLVVFYKRVREGGGEVVLRDASGQPLALLRLVQLERFMAVAVS
ncbi:MAG TPA: STAS domain-containing protein [Polyangia bacterium]|nr:STAS domain-containing protein [Polyangia bacterium]